MAENSGFTPYQGGMPALYTRYGSRQRGSGFLSAMKRYLIPLARTALPHVAGAVGDIVSGKGLINTLKSRGRGAGADILREAANVIGENPPSAGGSPPAKRVYKQARKTNTNRRKKGGKTTDKRSKRTSWS